MFNLVIIDETDVSRNLEFAVASERNRVMEDMLKGGFVSEMGFTLDEGSDVLIVKDSRKNTCVSPTRAR